MSKREKVMAAGIIILLLAFWSIACFIFGTNYADNDLASDARTSFNEVDEPLEQYDSLIYQEPMSEEEQVFKLIEILEKHLESAEIDFSFDENGLSGGKITILLK